MTLHETIAAARARLVAAGIAPGEAAIDVELYVRTILGWDRARLLVELRNTAPAGLCPRFEEWIARREQKEPTAYIVGVREFWGLEFTVTPAVLVPRPESEFIVEEALALVAPDAEARIADVGTGSGCLAISLARALPRGRLAATDISGEALAVARVNARRLGVEDRVRFVQTSYLDALPGPFDLIVSNPPYVKDADRAFVQRAVVRYEPHVALFGGEEGLDGVEAVLTAASTRLTPGGWVVFEFGLGQDDEIAQGVARFRQLRLDHIRADLQGVPRTAVVQRTT